MTGDTFVKLVEVMKRLRKECPWDREQTHDSIKAATLEETHELIEAIDDKDLDEMKEELGDVLLHIVFHSEMASEGNNFDIDDVIQGIVDKLIRRHPHVFGDVKVENNNEILRNWEQIKLTEKGRKSVLQGVPRQLPQLQRAFRLQEKASKVGFDWDDKDKVWEKVKEEIEEFETASRNQNSAEIEEELGDLLFSLTNYSRFIGVNPENALRNANRKFINRFNYVEQQIEKAGKNIAETDLEEMDKYWEESKREGI